MTQVDETTDTLMDQGQGTRRRLLDAAAEQFAIRGYRNVSVRDICEQACANIAAVNYHFGGKEKLYAEVIDHARRRALQEEPYAPGKGLSGPMDAEQRLRRYVRAVFGRAFATGPAGWYMQIVLRELVDPTPALTDVLDENLAPHQRRLEAIVGQLMQADPESDAVRDVAAAVFGVAVYFHSCRPALEHMRPGFCFDQASAERLTDRVVSMVVGGVAGEGIRG